MAAGGPGMVEEGGEGTSLEGLGDAWEADPVVRAQCLKNNSLLVWPDKRLIGVISFTTISLNVRVMELLLKLWCPQSSSGKTVNIDEVRKQDRHDEIVLKCSKFSSQYRSTLNILKVQHLIIISIDLALIVVHPYFQHFFRGKKFHP